MRGLIQIVIIGLHLLCAVSLEQASIHGGLDGDNSKDNNLGEGYVPFRGQDGVMYVKEAMSDNVLEPDVDYHEDGGESHSVKHIINEESFQTAEDHEKSKYLEVKRDDAETNNPEVTSSDNVKLCKSEAGDVQETCNEDHVIRKSAEDLEDTSPVDENEDTEAPFFVHSKKRSDEQQDMSTTEEGSTKVKQRFFPLLYTFRTLLTSFLSEFTGDSQDNAKNSSEVLEGNLTVTELVDKDTNSTGNGTDTLKKKRFQCAPKNISENATGEVMIVNSTELLEILNFTKYQKVSTCVLVLFYAPWCHFCARTAPHFNALARAYPQLDVLAVDTSHFSYLNARFGTVAVPNVMLFHSRSAVRFNHSVLLENFVEFVANNTGLEPNVSVTLEPFDYFGPLPSTAVKGRDWLLWLAWAFVLSCSGYGFVRSQYGQSIIGRLLILWMEHGHIE